MYDLYTLLDNPAWSALQTTHRHYALGTDTAKRYDPSVLAFTGLEQPTLENAQAIDPFIRAGELFFIIGELPPFLPSWELQKEVPCLQMVCEKEVPAAVENSLVQLLTEADLPDMLELINLVQPGFFLPGTPQAGRYYGIHQQGKLVAMAGERMQITGLTELSAVVTHPDFTGRQYAAQLVTRVTNENITSGNRLFLHVHSNNNRAIKVYERMGYDTRRPISFWLIKKG